MLNANCVELEKLYLWKVTLQPIIYLQLTPKLIPEHVFENAEVSRFGNASADANLNALEKSSLCLVRECVCAQVVHINMWMSEHT